ncbi:Nop14-like family protein [compost metagenome]
MTQKVKKAQRSAIREIRKDNAFLARAREEVVANEMKQRKEKYKEIINDLQSEKHQQYQLDFGNRQLSRDMKAARKGRKTGNQPVNRRK